MRKTVVARGGAGLAAAGGRAAKVRCSIWLLAVRRERVAGIAAGDHGAGRAQLPVLSPAGANRLGRSKGLGTCACFPPYCFWQPVLAWPRLAFTWRGWADRLTTSSPVC